jgi:hypothetical protein
MHAVTARESKKVMQDSVNVQVMIFSRQTLADVLAAVKCDISYSQTSKTTCCRRSGNFCTIVTGCPDVRDTPYMGAVVL